MSKIVPIAGTKNRVFIEISKTNEKKTDSGIFLIDDPEKAPTEGVVYAVSETDENGIPPVVKEGDYVYFPENAPNEIMIGTQTFLVLKENMLYAKKV